MAHLQKTYQKALLLAAFVLLLTVVLPHQVTAAEDDMWIEESPHGAPGQMDSERVKQLLDRIAEKDPLLATKLIKLQKDDPHEFMTQFHQALKETGVKIGRGWRRKPRSERDEHGRKRMDSDKETMGGYGGGGGGKHSMGGYSGGGGGKHSINGPGGMMGPDFMGPGGPGGGFTGMGYTRGRWKERVQDQHDEFIKWYEENYPEKAKKLLELRDKDPEKYMKSFKSAKKQYGEIMETEKKHPEHAQVLKDDLKLKRQRDSVIKKLSSAAGDEQAELKEKLEDIISRRFDLIIKKKQFKYDALKKRLERLQKEVVKREAELDKLIQTKTNAVKERMNELIGQSEKLNWE
jgi:exonuclease VII large subunit